MLDASTFYQHLDIQIRGQTSNATSLSYCGQMATVKQTLSEQSSPTTAYLSSSFLTEFPVCFQTTTADVFDVIFLYDGVPLPGMPCIGCITVKASNVSVADVVVDGLQSSLMAGNTLYFVVLLRDAYQNIIPRDEYHTISFSPNDHLSITPSDVPQIGLASSSNSTTTIITTTATSTTISRQSSFGEPSHSPPFPSPNNTINPNINMDSTTLLLDFSIYQNAGYFFKLYVNHTCSYTFKTFVDGQPLPGQPSTVQINVSGPYFFSYISFPKDSKQGHQGHQMNGQMVSDGYYTTSSSIQVRFVNSCCFLKES